MRKIARFSLIILALSAVVWLTACERTLSGSEKADVLAFSETVADNLFVGLTANDYAAFSRDFDSDMREEIPTPDFAVWKQELNNQFGTYLSRKVDRVTRADEFYVVYYQVNVEQEEPVTVSVAFHGSDQSIAYLSFDSEEFSWTPFQERK